VKIRRFRIPLDLRETPVTGVLVFQHRDRKKETPCPLAESEVSHCHGRVDWSNKTHEQERQCVHRLGILRHMI
jgi:hypothetical protein